MEHITLEEPWLVERLNQVAASRGASAAELLEVAVREFLERQDELKLEAERQAARQMEDALLAQYAGKVVAIHNGEVIDADADPTLLHLRVRRDYGDVRVLFRQIPSKEDAAGEVSGE